jgi:hypothetical protein
MRALKQLQTFADDFGAILPLLITALIGGATLLAVG